MQFNILILGIAPFLSGLSLADELIFSNSRKWLSDFGGEWSVTYCIEDSVPTDYHESPVQFVEDRYHVEVADGPIQKLNLYYNDEFLFELKKDKRGRWLVPKLARISFDLRSLKPLHQDEIIGFVVIDPMWHSLGATVAGEAFDRFVQHGARIEVNLVNVTRRNADSTTKALILVPEADHGVIALKGDIRGSWSTNVSWSLESGSVAGKTSPSGEPPSAPHQPPEGPPSAKPDPTSPQPPFGQPPAKPGLEPK